MTVAVTVVMIVLVYDLYKRFFPVIGLEETDIQSFAENEESQIVDVRQFQLAHNEPVKGSLNMPLAYLTRHYRDIDGIKLYLVVSDKVERNISARFLKKQGFIIQGYQMKREDHSAQLETSNTSMSKVCKEL